MSIAYDVSTSSGMLRCSLLRIFFIYRESKNHHHHHQTFSFGRAKSVGRQRTRYRARRFTTSTGAPYFPKRTKPNLNLNRTISNTVDPIEALLAEEDSLTQRVSVVTRSKVHRRKQ
jgi:hypothetical protein